MLLTEPSTNLVACEFETNIIVLGLLAAVYSCGWNKAKIKHWGSGFETRKVVIDGHQVSATASTLEIDGRKVRGIQLQIEMDRHNGGTDKVRRWFPFEELERVVATIKGIQN